MTKEIIQAVVGLTRGDKVVSLVLVICVLVWLGVALQLGWAIAA